MSHAGRLSIICGALSWIALACALIYGGLGPTVSETWLLRALSSGSAIMAAIGALLAIFALVRGPQRISGALGLILTAAFLLTFTGALFGLIS